MNPNGSGLAPGEHAAILAEWQRLAAEPPPVNPRPYGCATFLIAAALLLGIPPLLNALGARPPELLGLVLKGILVLALAGGFFVGVFVGNGIYGRAYTRANAALDWLSANPESGDAAERRRNAVALLEYTFVSDGPTSSVTIDIGKARERLGASLAYIVAVERALRAERKVDPIFTEREDASPAV